MALKQDQNEKLREVKAILQRLQRIGDDAAGEIMASGQAAAVERGRGELENLLTRGHTPPQQQQPPQQPLPPPRAEVNRTIELVAPAAVAAPPKSNGQAGTHKIADAKPLPSKRRSGAVPIIAVLGVAAIAAGASYWLTVAGNPFSGSRGEIARGSGSPLTAAHLGSLEKARRLMDSGQIVAARQILKQPALAAAQDGAWLIARSFDPNYLSSIPAADAGADKTLAAEAYHRWREIAGRNGVIMDDARLNRIIDSMR